MKISAIQTYKPVFTSIRRAENNQPVSCPDSFIKSEFDFNNEADIYYSKLQKNMGIITPQNIVNQANRISRKTGVKLDDVYKTMGLLSQFSSYKSLAFIRNNLRDVMGILPLNNIYGKDNKSICLSSVLSYIADKNDLFYPNGVQEKQAVVLDSNLLNFLENNKGFKEDLLSNPQVQFVYINNFENGYNFLNQSKSFEDFTIDILEKAKIFQKNNNKDIDYNVKYVLNGQNLKKMKELSGGGQIKVLNMENICTPEQIADNLNPILPSNEEFKSIITKITGNKLNFQKEVLKYLNDNMIIITPRDYCEHLEDIHKNLLKFLEKNNKTMDDVYFLIPDVKKSFVVANYIYQNINNVKDAKTIFLPRQDEDIMKLIKQLPENSAAVIVDDCILSGLSMKCEVFPYDEIAPILSKDKSIIFASVATSKLGYDKLNNIACENNRNDKIISGNLFENVNKRYGMVNFVYDIEAGKYLTTSVILPYMGPDYNCEELVPLYEQFFYSPKAQKPTITDLSMMVFC